MKWAKVIDGDLTWSRVIYDPANKKIWVNCKYCDDTLRVLIDDKIVQFTGLNGETQLETTLYTPFSNPKTVELYLYVDVSNNLKIGNYVPSNAYAIAKYTYRQINDSTGYYEYPMVYIKRVKHDFEELSGYEPLYANKIGVFIGKRCDVNFSSDSISYSLTYGIASQESYEEIPVKFFPLVNTSKDIFSFYESTDNSVSDYNLISYNQPIFPGSIGWVYNDTNSSSYSKDYFVNNDNYVNFMTCNAGGYFTIGYTYSFHCSKCEKVPLLTFTYLTWQPGENFLQIYYDGYDGSVNVWVKKPAYVDTNGNIKYVYDDVTIIKGLSSYDIDLLVTCKYIIRDYSAFCDGCSFYIAKLDIYVNNIKYSLKLPVHKNTSSQDIYVIMPNVYGLKYDSSSQQFTPIIAKKGLLIKHHYRGRIYITSFGKEIITNIAESLMLKSLYYKEYIALPIEYSVACDKLSVYKIKVTDVIIGQDGKNYQLHANDNDELYVVPVDMNGVNIYLKDQSTDNVYLLTVDENGNIILVQSNENSSSAMSILEFDDHENNKHVKLYVDNGELLIETSPLS